MDYTNIISFISSLGIVKQRTVVLACGSALIKENPVDVDFIVYTQNKEKFLSKFKGILQRKNIETRHVFIEKLNVHSLKFQYRTQTLSFLIVDFKSIKSYIRRADDPNVYADINIFDFELCYPLIYRKWVQETKFLLGNMDTYNLLTQCVANIKIPQQAMDICRAKILNTSKYLRRKEKTSLLAKNIVQNELANNLIVYLYVLNNKFIGTVPYIERDLLEFEKGKQLAKIAIQLIQNCGEIQTEKILELVEEYNGII